MEFIIKKQNLIQYFVLFLYKISLDILYVIYISPAYVYSGFLYKPNLQKYIVSFLLLIFMAKHIVSFVKTNTVSSLIMLLLNLFYFVPAATLYSFAGFPDAYFLFFALYWIITMFLYNIIPNFKLPRIDLQSSRILVIAIFFILIIGSLIITGVYNNFRFNFSLDNVYDLRAEQKNMNLPTIVSYFQPIASAILPIAIVFTLINKQYLFALIFIIIDLLHFGFGGHKNTLFSLILAVVIFLFYNKSMVKLIIAGFLGLNIISFVELILAKKSYMVIYIIRRSMFVPNLISYQYYDFFSNHELLLLKNSILRRFGFVSPYNMDIADMIGLLYHGYVTHANNGMCGDAFANFGWGGLLFFPLLLVVSFKLAEACAKNLNAKIILIFSVYYALSFVNGAFFSNLLTNGFIFASLFMYLLSSINHKNITQS